jgi:hypothetical protein
LGLGVHDRLIAAVQMDGYGFRGIGGHSKVVLGTLQLSLQGGGIGPQVGKHVFRHFQGCYHYIKKQRRSNFTIGFFGLESSTSKTARGSGSRQAEFLGICPPDLPDVLPSFYCQ